MAAFPAYANSSVADYGTLQNSPICEDPVAQACSDAIARQATQGLEAPILEPIDGAGPGLVKGAGKILKSKPVRDAVKADAKAAGKGIAKGAAIEIGEEGLEKVLTDLILRLVLNHRFRADLQAQAAGRPGPLTII